MHASWMAHLCGLCLALRDDHGQLARTATNYDGLVISVLVEAQSPVTDTQRRTAGPCPLRGMRSAPVARGEGARLAAAVSLALASVKVRDHVLDGDGVFARRPVAAGARRVTRRWDRQSADSAAAVGFDTGVLLAAARRQEAAETAVTAGGPLLLATAPTEEATAAAFAHTAHLANRPRNAAPLAEAGRLFGRLAHLLDAAEDRHDDETHGHWNPLTVTGTTPDEAERLCRDAVQGIRLALKEVEFTDRTLAHLLLAHETGEAVDRVFGRERHHESCAHRNASATASPYDDGLGAGAGSGAGGQGGQGVPLQKPLGAFGAPEGYDLPGAPGGSGGAGGSGGRGGYGGAGGSGGSDGPKRRPPKPPKPPRPQKPPRGLVMGCLAWATMACTCQLLCCEHDHPFTRERRESFCDRNCGGCGNCDDGGCCSGCGAVCECLSCCGACA
ncbi:putative regulatory protein [Kitasatospora setae KM-6054]|uniref:Putative regulatory protein n=2 Tax=Streptomycetaceae TaxID=2062 RepID=E4N6C9_KITSK|nr:putative regulatory protein [Kitasatospora setae KM-6054]